ncbi:MAG: phospho-N-acetylmuramoyl-pentapeptide-transferase [bacterium]
MNQFIIIKIFLLTTLSFALAMSWTPALTHFLYKYKLGKSIRSEENAPIMSKLHQHKSGTPTMGGILIWVTVLVLAIGFYILSTLYDGSFTSLNFLSRSQTLLPLGALIATAFVGLADDFIDIKSNGSGGMKVIHRLGIYTLISIFGAFWFFYKLGWDIIHVPFVGNFGIGWWYIPVFIFVIVATSFSVNEADGLDGLAGGMLLVAFGAYGAIAFNQGKYDLATFCGVIIGALVAFLWFNIIPARFIMGDTGAMSLGVTLGVIAMLTNYALLLPIICFVFMIESLSVIIQKLSKKIRKKKIWISTPIHHHFEAKGWPEAKVVMRFWLISGVMSVVGLIIFLLDKRL